MGRVAAFLSRHQQFVNGFRFIVIGLLITLLLVGAKFIFERSSVGHRVELLSYEFLEGQLTAIDTDPLPVVVVDISQIGGGGTEEDPTPRGPLQKLLEAIVNQQPKAIAIDADFSPKSTGWIDEQKDPDFFSFCVGMKALRGVPIFLGVHRALASPPNTWLGLDEYKESAVGLLVNDETSRLPIWIQRKDGGSEKLRTLGTAVAEVYRGGSLPQPPSWLRWMIQRPGKTDSEIRDANSTPIEVTNGLVNYSKLEMIQLTTIPTINPNCIAEAKQLFQNKIVILGRDKAATDRYTVYGRVQTVPGVFLHACAAYTLIKEPLYELNLGSQLGADLAISMLVILPVAWFRFRQGAHQSLAWHRRQSKYAYMAAGLVFIGGILLVRFLHVMWLDFFPLMLALLVHPWVEKRLGDLARRKRARKAAINRRRVRA